MIFESTAQGRAERVGAPLETHPEPQQVPVDQFLLMLRFEKKHKLMELPLNNI